MTSPLFRIPTKHRESRTWPSYLLGGRVRTSTVSLIVAFFVAYWVHQTYAPPPPPPTPPPAVVPPGFVPNPDYTWVPRTDVMTRPRSTYRPTPTETTETTETTEPTETTSETPTTTSSTSLPPTTTVITPAPGILPPITLPVLPGQAPPPPPSSPPPPGPVTTTVISPGALPVPGPSQ
ncbi:hypothetical protein BOO86_04970 [Mycobacterium sp. CBMA 234]|uniref:hypothetical protein n=1 Tax=Mycolicibacterium sp. CBMA 234 TaxID=1918495 RepID=UPI001391D336|nr:hypothetical protein [Mycolicibacterium sp. CBMA 234]MUL63807.1 hypothetical protein [Mycolicibacterium sp. CBMA 234]